jgi:hypothetical protein
MNAPYTDRLAFVKYQSAGACFEMVHDISSFFLATGLHRREKIHDPLLVSLHVLYARPFKQRKPLRLEETIVPAESQALHEMLITLRDKMHAHTDLDGPQITDDVMMNELTAYTKDGRTKVGISVFNPNAEMHRGILQLVECLKKTTHEETDKIWKRYMSKHKVPDGAAIVNLARDDGPFLMPHPVEEHEELRGFFVDVREWKQKGEERRSPHY